MPFFSPQSSHSSERRSKKICRLLFATRDCLPWNSFDMLILNTIFPAGLMKRTKGSKGSEPHSVALKWESDEVTAKLKILQWLLPRRKTQSSLLPALPDLFCFLTLPSPASQPLWDPLMLLNLGVPPTSGSFSPCSLWHDHPVFYPHGCFISYSSFHICSIIISSGKPFLIFQISSKSLFYALEHLHLWFQSIYHSW